MQFLINCFKTTTILLYLVLPHSGKLLAHQFDHNYVYSIYSISTGVVQRTIQTGKTLIVHNFPTKDLNLSGICGRWLQKLKIFIRTCDVLNINWTQTKIYGSNYYWQQSMIDFNIAETHITTLSLVLFSHGKSRWLTVSRKVNVYTRNQSRDFPTWVPSTQPLTQPMPQHAKEQPVITATTAVSNFVSKSGHSSQVTAHIPSFLFVCFN